MGNTISSTCSDLNAYNREGRGMLRCAEAGSVDEMRNLLWADVGYLKYRSVVGGNSAWHKAAKAGQVDALRFMAAQVRWWEG